MHPILTARFWVQINGGWVKLAVPFQTTLSWRRYETTDEGYRVTCGSWVFDVDENEKLVVEWDYSSRERDCDGVIDRSGKLVCPVDDLKCILPFESRNVPGLLPNWTTEESHYRDHAAEAAGY